MRTEPVSKDIPSVRGLTNDDQARLELYDSIIQKYVDGEQAAVDVGPIFREELAVSTDRLPRVPSLGSAEVGRIFARASSPASSVDTVRNRTLLTPPVDRPGTPRVPSRGSERPQTPLSLTPFFRRNSTSPLDLTEGPVLRRSSTSPLDPTEGSLLRRNSTSPVDLTEEGSVLRSSPTIERSSSMPVLDAGKKA